MIEKLSQEEIEALIAALENEDGDQEESSVLPVTPKQPEKAGGDPTPRQQTGTSKPPAVSNPMPYFSPQRKPVRTYDFRRPDKFSKEQIRTMLLLHETFTRNASTSLSAYVRHVVQIEAVHIGQCTYMQWLQQVSEPTVLAVVSLAPLPGKALLELPTDIAFPMLDRLLGGHGATMEQKRALTEIETRVVKHILHIFLNAWVEAWRPVTSLTATLESTEGNPLFVQLMPPGEMTISILFDIKLDDVQGIMRMCIPFTLLEPVLHKLSAHNWFARDGMRADQMVKDRWLEHLAPIDVKLQVQLPKTQITVRDFIDLSVGDVITLPGSIHDDLTMSVNGVPRFRVMVGTIGKRLAARIRSVEED